MVGLFATGVESQVAESIYVSVLAKIGDVGKKKQAW